METKRIPRRVDSVRDWRSEFQCKLTTSQLEKLNGKLCKEMQALQVDKLLAEFRLDVIERQLSVVAQVLANRQEVSS